MPSDFLRLCEYQSVRVDWSREVREAVLAAAEVWKEAHGLSQPPLNFEGADGCTLCVQQHVGVIEAGGVCVEIYPKLDTALMDDPGLIESRASSVMTSLLWLLEESGYAGLVDAGEASVEESPDSISDLLAWLFARRLRHQLSLGMPQEYVSQRDDLPLVRGRIEFARQATVLFGRPDVIACAWDEFTPDTPLARLLRCATELLLNRVRLPGAAADLRDALAMLEEVEPVHPLEALSAATTIRWSRLNARWRPCLDLALAVLRGLGREMHAGGTESFVFLLDMNQLFESYCTRWIERTSGAVVHEQVRLGSLLISPTQKLGQDADFLWHQGDEVWVGDAKYKRPFGDDWPKIDDVRQLICYGQLATQRHPGKASRLMLLHPTTGPESSEEWQTFAGQPLRLQSVRVVKSSWVRVETLQG
jgi:5-methylcytosine-specific restriction enzyme subunit McrC